MKRKRIWEIGGFAAGIVLILFGAQRLPDLARSLGSSVKEFKKGVNELSKDEAPAKKDEEKKA